MECVEIGFSLDGFMVVTRGSSVQNGMVRYFRSSIVGHSNGRSSLRKGWWSGPKVSVRALTELFRGKNKKNMAERNAERKAYAVVWFQTKRMFISAQLCNIPLLIAYAKQSLKFVTSVKNRLKKALQTTQINTALAFESKKETFAFLFCKKFHETCY